MTVKLVKKFALLALPLLVVAVAVSMAPAADACGAEKQCPFKAEVGEFSSENVADGVVITLTSDNPELVAHLQEMVQRHASGETCGHGGECKHGEDCKHAEGCKHGEDCKHADGHGEGHGHGHQQ